LPENRVLIESGFCHFTGNRFSPLKINPIPAILGCRPSAIDAAFPCHSGRAVSIRTSPPVFRMEARQPPTVFCPQTPRFSSSIHLLTPCVDFGMIAGNSRYPNTPQSHFSVKNNELRFGTRLAFSFGNM
jgi:hypothetical protein